MELMRFWSPEEIKINWGEEIKNAFPKDKRNRVEKNIELLLLAVFFF